MAYTWKGNDIIAPIRISSNQPEFISETASLKRLVTSQDAQRWELTFGVSPTTDAGSLFVAMTQGALGSSTMTIPQVYKSGSTNECSTAATSNGATSSGASSVPIALGTGDIGKSIYAGTFVKFGGHDKVYMVINTEVAANATTKSTMTLDIYPSLRSNVTTAQAVTYLDDVTLSYWMGDQVKGISYQDGIVAQVASLEVLEAI